MSDAGVIVRAVVSDDAEAIVALLEPIVAAGTWSTMASAGTVGEQRAFMAGMGSRGIYHAAVEGASGRLVGIQDVAPLDASRTHAHVGVVSTFVAIDEHRRGVGRALMRATVDAARERGYTKVTAMIRADNPAALAYYTACGFRIVGIARRHARIGDTLVDVAMAERHLHAR